MIKKIIILGLLVFSTLINTQAQCWDLQVPNTITTDWRAANTSNTWDWTQETFNDMYIIGRSNPCSAISPFWSPQSSSGTNILLSDFRDFVNRDDKDFHPEDGWELLAKNFGEYSVNGTRDVANPFFALYNRNTGKVRAFLMVADIPTSSQNGALLRAQFSGNRATALWQHMKPIGQAVENFDRSLNADLNNEYRNQPNYWLFSEFVVAYDPCTCLDLGDPTAKFEGDLYYSFDENSSSNFTFSSNPQLISISPWIESGVNSESAKILLVENREAINFNNVTLITTVKRPKGQDSA